MLHSDYITHINNEEDVIYLRSKLLPVNMRLFYTSPQYKAIVLQCCEYIKFLCLSKMDGYKKPHGMSGANAAIPFNIIAYCVNRGTQNEFINIMINPIITQKYGNTIQSLSNCGSLTLEDAIVVGRSEWIIIKFYDEEGVNHEMRINAANYGKTIQHEVDHNLGILITDLEIKN